VRPGRAADHSPPSNAAVMEEYSYTATHPLGHTGPVTGSLNLYLFYSSLILLPGAAATLVTPLQPRTCLGYNFSKFPT